MYNTRYFNKIVEIPGTNYIKKSSKNKSKIYSEYKYYEKCNSIMKNFMVNVFDFKDDGEEASYIMEKINQKDFGYKYVNDILTEKEFLSFLKQFKTFKDSDIPINLSKNEMKIISKELIINKTLSRINVLPIDYFIIAEGVLTRLNYAFDYYFENRSTFRLVPSHGDPCFSNIMMDNDKLKMIDPKGHEYIFMDEYYDIAKISHSLLGGYDFIKNDYNKFQAKYTNVFNDFLNDYTLSKELMRVYEASLFLSMCPMHIDRKDHIEKFILKAEDILKNLNF
jgi:hypothetical protein